MNLTRHQVDRFAVLRGFTLLCGRHLHGAWESKASCPPCGICDKGVDRERGGDPVGQAPITRRSLQNPKAPWCQSPRCHRPPRSAWGS